MRHYVLTTCGSIDTVISIGHTFQKKGINNITMIKLSPYLNMDAGTLPGESYILNDGEEVEVDFGVCERYLDIKLTHKNNITLGKIYSSVISQERQGEYLKEVVDTSHVTNEIIKRIESVNADVCILHLPNIDAIFLQALDYFRKKYSFTHLHTITDNELMYNKYELEPDYIFCINQSCDFISEQYNINKCNIVTVMNPQNINIFKSPIVYDRTVTIAIIGVQSSYLSIKESLIHAGQSIEVNIDVIYVDCDNIDPFDLFFYDAIIIPGEVEGKKGKVEVCKFSRKNNIPLLGIGFGCLYVGIEDWKCEIVENMIKGTQAFIFKEGSRLESIYGATNVEERCHYMYSIKSLKDMYAFELPSHRFYIGVQYHPEFNSTLKNPHPLFLALVNEAILVRTGQD